MLDAAAEADVRRIENVIPILTNPDGGAAGQSTLGQLRAILLSDNADARAWFLTKFEELVADFLAQSTRTYDRLAAFAGTVGGDRRAAWTEAFLFSAFNASFTSCHLLLSGLPIPAGNLMRHYGESLAMALLCSHHGLDVFERIDKEPSRFSVDKAMQMIRRRATARLLNIIPSAWDRFVEITSWYDRYSHATPFSLAEQRKLSESGVRLLGGGFDDFKLDGYRKELRMIVSAMATLYETIEMADRNVRDASGS